MFSEFWWGLSRFLISLVWTQFYLWKFLRICCSTCQRSENSLFQWNSPVFCSNQCFLDFNEGFRKNWFHLPRWSSVCKSCSVFVAELVKEAKTCCCVGILKLFCSDQCFLYFGAEFQENYWMPLFSIDLCGEFQSFLIVEALSAAIGIGVMKLHSGRTFVSVLGYRVSRFSDGVFIGKICTVWGAFVFFFRKRELLFSTFADNNPWRWERGKVFS